MKYFIITEHPSHAPSRHPGGELGTQWSLCRTYETSPHKWRADAIVIIQDVYNHDILENNESHRVSLVRLPPHLTNPNDVNAYFIRLRELACFICTPNDYEHPVPPFAGHWSQAYTASSLPRYILRHQRHLAKIAHAPLPPCPSF